MTEPSRSSNADAKSSTEPTQTCMQAEAARYPPRVRRNPSYLIKCTGGVSLPAGQPTDDHTGIDSSHLLDEGHRALDGGEQPQQTANSECCIE